MVPPPERDPMTWLKPPKSRVTPETLLNTTGEFGEKMFGAPPLSIPPSTLVVPKNEFTPVRVNIPLPDFTKLPDPLICPENVELVPFIPRVNVAEPPRLTFPPRGPPPDRESIVWSKLFKSNKAPSTLLITTGEFWENTSKAPAWSVPDVTFVFPV